MRERVPQHVVRVKTVTIDWAGLLARGADAPAFADFGAAFVELMARGAGLAPFERAVAGGLASDRLGWAFVAGYQAALAALVPGLSTARPAALLATEAGGAHPRAIATRLERDARGRRALTGRKVFASCASGAATLLVVARVGERDDGRPDLRLVRVEAPREGVTLAPMPAIPFAPEVPHAEVGLDAVAVADDEVLEGDGYARWLKPFRTVEDTFVTAAFAAYAFGLTRRARLDASLLASSAGLVAALAGVAESPTESPATHVALAGALADAARLADALAAALAATGGEEAARFERDRPLLRVASSARTKRALAAVRALGLATPPEPGSS